MLTAEELRKKTQAVTIDGRTNTADNLTEKLEIQNVPTGVRFTIIDGAVTADRPDQRTMWASTGDVPALALAALHKAGYVPDLNGGPVNVAMAYLNQHAWVAAQNAARDAARDARRNELAKEFDAAHTYAEAFPSAQRAIDRIIELEATTLP